MAKTLSESAAEILKASMNAGKEPAQSLPAEKDDLGGQTPTELPSAIGAAASANRKEAPKPGSAGVPAEPIKKLAGSEAHKVGDEEEGLKKNPVDTGSYKAEETEVEGEVVAEDKGDVGTEAKPLLKPGQKIGKMNIGEEQANEEVEQIDEDHADAYDKHMTAHYNAAEKGDWDKAETHAQRAENAAARHFKATGKKIYDPGYTGSSKHITQVKEETEISEQDDAAARQEMKEAWKKKAHKSMAEDVDALFNGESLSEEFRTKATTIFEAAVNARIDTIIEEMMTENDAVLAEAYDSLKEEMATQVDEYLNYVVESWMEDNKVAIETGLRAELVDDFIGGLKNLFAEHYIEIPEEKVDVAEELAQRVAALEEEAAARDAEKAAIVEELNVAKKNESIRKICEGLTETQIAKMKTLAEGVEFTTEGEFNGKLAVIRENYFPVGKVQSEVKTIQETTVSEEPEVAEVHGLMKHYVNAITKTAPKA